MEIALIIILVLLVLQDDDLTKEQLEQVFDYLVEKELE